ncbi:Regulator of microtubule dynamics protein 2 [Clonorchis sinensis]|uniref:Regulator of microtubule dynamics protein 2 n=1 Tax=Clonorchis sinensis TaxID=79923 RepID=A0A3R7D696_CLOSI|nr:Regulator of microtubule dynamics protein 2 [Clonorchis sinensis]
MDIQNPGDLLKEATDLAKDIGPEQAYQLVTVYMDKLEFRITPVYSLAASLCETLAKLFAVLDKDRYEHYITKGYRYSKAVLRHISACQSRLHGPISVDKRCIQNQNSLKALELNPGDGTIFRSLGIWHYTVANWSWMQRKVACAMYANPPTSSIPEALKYFLDAEVKMGRTSAVNSLDIARCYAKMNKGAQAKKYLDECLASVDEGREIEQKGIDKILMALNCHTTKMSLPKSKGEQLFATTIMSLSCQNKRRWVNYCLPSYANLATSITGILLSCSDKLIRFMQHLQLTNQIKMLSAKDGKGCWSCDSNPEPGDLVLCSRLDTDRWLFSELGNLIVNRPSSVTVISVDKRDVSVVVRWVPFIPIKRMTNEIRDYTAVYGLQLGRRVVVGSHSIDVYLNVDICYSVMDFPELPQQTYFRSSHRPFVACGIDGKFSNQYMDLF